MPLNIVIGTQWGDEGKGTITDLMAEQTDIVARYSGGDNAGHTVTVGDDIFKLHLVNAQPHFVEIDDLLHLGLCTRLNILTTNG